MINLEKIKPEDLWYVIGLLATDGNLSKDGRHINITSKHESYLLLVRNALGLTGLISKKARASEKEKKYSTLQFSDVNFYHYLQSIGFFPKKSLTLGKIDIDMKYFFDFLRGVIDGDGSLRGWTHKSNGHQQWSLAIYSGAPIFIQWLKVEIEENFHINGRLYTYLGKEKKNAINILKFGKLPMKVIVSQIYYDGCLCLARKMAIAKLCLQDEDQMVNYGGVLRPGAVIGSQN